MSHISNSNTGHSSKSKGVGSGVAGGSGATAFQNVGSLFGDPGSIFNKPPLTNGNGLGLFQQQPSIGNLFGANAGQNP